MKLRKITKHNKKGSIIDLIMWLVISFVTVAFLGLWAYGFNSVSTTLQNVDSGSSIVNISDAAADTFGQVNSAQLYWLNILAFTMIFGMGLSIFISNFLVKAHPAFFVVYLLVTISGIIVSVYLSNQYELLMVNDLVGSTFSSWGATSFIMLYLPIWTSVIGIFGAVFLFSGILRDRELGGSI